MSKIDIFNERTIEGCLAAPGSKWRRYPPDVIPMYVADPDFPVADEIKDALIKSVREEDLFYNTDVEIREAMADKITAKNKFNATYEDILITQGVSPGMWLAIRHACKEDGDEVVVTNPMYGPFSSAAKATKTKALIWNLDFEDGYRFDIDALKELITPKTKLIFICNPHNPTGRMLTKEDLKGIADVAVDNNIKVFSDELHEDIVFDGRKHISIAALNPEIKVEGYKERLTPTNARAIIADYDLVADGSDNFTTRYLVNDSCYLERKPLVTAAMLRFEGQATTIKAYEEGMPCYRCIFPSAPSAELAPRCEEAGIFGALAGVLGTMQTTEVLKELLGLGTGLAGRLLLYDAMDVMLRTVNIPKNRECPLCGDNPTITDV